MEKSLRNRLLVALITGVFSLLWAAARAEAEGNRAPVVAYLSAGPASLDWQPLVAYERLVLTVAGPENLFLRRAFEASQSPSLGLFDSRGLRLPEGVYVYELRVIPRITPLFREKLTRARATGNDERMGELLRRQGLPKVQTGTFWVHQGSFVTAGFPEPRGGGPVENRTEPQLVATTAADQVVADDLIVTGRACIGLSCLDGEAFGSNTLHLKQSTVRINLIDTDTAATVPTNDWQITANDETSGGANRFSIEDVDAATVPFTIRAGAPSHSLYVGASGDVGFGTATPAEDLHAVSDDSPTLRLEQDGTGGFLPQVWDLVGNEISFFVRDVTGSTIPLRIQPDAPTDTFVIHANGGVGVGTASPTERLHVFENVNANAISVVENPNLGTSAAAVVRAKSDTAFVNLIAHGSGRTGSRFGQVLTSWGEVLAVGANGLILGTLDNKPIILGTNNTNRLHITGAGDLGVGTTAPASKLHVFGDVRVTGGSFIDDGTTLNVPDYVFEPEYTLMPLEDLRAFVERERHLPNIPKASEIQRDGLDIGRFQMRLLEKVEELTLYTLAQQEEIQALRDRNAELEEQLRREGAALQARLTALEKAVGPRD